MKAREVPKKLHQYLLKRWVISALIPLVPSFFGLAVRHQGTAWGLTDATGELTSVGAWLFWLLLPSALLFALIKAAADNYDRGVTENDGLILKSLLDSVNSVTRSKLRRFEAFLGKLGSANANPNHPFAEITQPQQQIERILENIQVALAEIHDVRRDDIGISLACHEEGRWRWLALVNVENDLDIDTLCNDPKTTFSLVVNKKQGSAFFADKRKAIEQDVYVPSKRDRSHNNVGSIVVRDLTVGDGATTLPAVLSIGTYGLQLCAEDDYGAEKAFNAVLLPCFESRLRLELCLYLIKKRFCDGERDSNTTPMASGPVEALAR